MPLLPPVITMTLLIGFSGSASGRTSVLSRGCSGNPTCQQTPRVGVRFACPSGRGARLEVAFPRVLLRTHRRETTTQCSGGICHRAPPRLPWEGRPKAAHTACSIVATISRDEEPDHGRPRSAEKDAAHRLPHDDRLLVRASVR